MKMLIIDDEIAALTKMKALMSAYGDCTMTTHAEQAVRLFEAALISKLPFDLVAIDIYLSQANGLDILEVFTRMENEADVSKSVKIMVSASGTKANLIKAHTKGCDGFLVKPVKRDILAEKMQSLGFLPKPAASQDAFKNAFPAPSRDDPDRPAPAPDPL